MITMTILAAALAAGALLADPGAPPAAEADKLQILTTTTDLRDIASRVGGERVEARSLLKGPEDPHFIDAKPSFVALARKADVFIKIGLALEAAYETPILTDSRNSKIQPGAPGHVDASVDITKLDIPAAKVDRSQGDVHPEGNPHYLLDPMNAKRAAATIRDAFARAAPAHRSEFDDRCKQFCRTVDERMFGEKIINRFSPDTLADLLSAGKLKEFLKTNNAEGEIGGWAAALLPASGKPVVVYHKHLTYFTRRFHIEEAASIEPKPGVQPSSAHLSQVIETIKSRGIKAVYHTVFQAPQVVEKVCESTGASKIQFPHQVSAVAGADDYITMIEMIVKATSDALAKP